MGMDGAAGDAAKLAAETEQVLRPDVNGVEIWS